MDTHTASNLSGYSGLIAVLASFDLTNALQLTSLFLGIIFLLLGCTLRILDLKDRTSSKSGDN